MYIFFLYIASLVFEYMDNEEWGYNTRTHYTICNVTPPPPVPNILDPVFRTVAGLETTAPPVVCQRVVSCSILGAPTGVVVVVGGVGGGGVQPPNNKISPSTVRR